MFLDLSQALILARDIVGNSSVLGGGGYGVA
jgi:hypothetical protein